MVEKLSQKTIDELLNLYGELHQTFVQCNDYFKRRLILNKMNSINLLLDLPEIKELTIYGSLKKIGL